MNHVERFLVYAGDFERTYKDDDWERLLPYFAEDALYEVKNTAFECRLEGPRAIVSGMHKSVDGLDRKFATRRIDVLAPPELLDDGLAVAWKATYEKEGIPALTMRARTEVRFAGDRIRYMADVYEDPGGDAARWMRAYGAGFDPSYT